MLNRSFICNGNYEKSRVIRSKYKCCPWVLQHILHTHIVAARWRCCIRVDSKIRVVLDGKRKLKCKVYKRGSGAVNIRRRKSKSLLRHNNKNIIYMALYTLPPHGAHTSKNGTAEDEWKFLVRHATYWGILDRKISVQCKKP